jgi:nucleotide-binding universal stress UspA family protein
MAFARILCGIDFSQTSLAAFQQAVELAQLGAGSLCILHSIEAQPFVSDLPGIDEMGETAIKLNEKAAAAMESLIASSAPVLDGIPLTTEITAGRAFVEILNYARDWSADLIVLGAEGEASFGQIVVGSTAERVMKGAQCSVLIVRQSLAGREESDLADRL